MSQAIAGRVVVIGAGPVGLCLALRLAQQDVPVVLVEALGADNFLEQVPRAGTNHPATLELFDAIGLYDKLEPRGIVAPLFHYWDRHENKLIAAFDHAHLRDDTRFPYVLQCERIKIVEEALRLAQAHPLIDVRLSTTFESIRAGCRRRRRACDEPGRQGRGDRRRLPGECRRRTQHRAQGSRHRVRGLHVFGPHA